MVDVGIALALGITTLGMAYLGIHVTLYPANSQKQKSLYKWMFFACGIVLLVLIGLQAARVHRSQKELHRSQQEAAEAIKKLGTDLENVRSVFTRIAENASKASYPTERKGRTAVQENAIEATIIHGYDDPAHAVVVYPAANWNTTLWPVSQDRTSISF